MTNQEIMELAKDFSIEGELIGFANAIAKHTVKECMKHAHDKALRYYDMDAPDYALAMLDYRQTLKEHFGVKE